METATLRIRASGIVERARVLTRDGRHLDAMSMLSDALVGISAEQCIAIVSGRCTLVDGEDGILMVEDVDPSYREELRSNYGGRLRIGEEWFKPYAIVTDLGPNDEGFGLPHCRARTWAIASGENTSYFQRHRSDERRLHQQCIRPLHYADDATRDRLIYVDGAAFLGRVRGLDRLPLCVILRQVDAPPSWIKGSAHLTEAVIHAAEDGELRITGHRVEYGASPTIDVLEDAEDEERLAELQAEEERQRQAFVAHCADIASKVRERAGPEDGDGWIALVAGDRVIPVPRGPFEGWALSRAGASELAAWVPVSESGLKLMNDNPWHSDWMLAAGLPLDAMYEGRGTAADHELAEAAHDLAERIQRERLNFRHEVLAGSGEASGPAWIARRGDDGRPPPGAVVVLPDASPEWLDVVAEAAAIVTERGGAMAHLVNVMRPGGIPIVRMRGATSSIPGGIPVTVSCTDGSIVLGGRRHAVEIALGMSPRI